MKIIQICLCGSYNPQMGYQDNILPKYYVKLGYNCVIVTSQYYKEKGTVVRDIRKKVTLSDKIELIRLPNKYGLSYKINKILRMYGGLYEILVDEKPDIIFLHNFQFLSIKGVVRYCKHNRNVKIYADSHTDYVNSATNWFSMNILHKIIWRYYVKQIEPYIIKFWGVTEQRCKFLHEVYKIPQEKIGLLVMGADHDKIDFINKNKIRNEIRKKLSMLSDDFIIITGGKIDRNKNIHLLIDAVNKIANPNIKLVIFGSLDNEMKKVIEPKLNNPNIKYIGWLESDKVYDYFLAADLGVFPGTHSVLWEQAIGTGLPCIFKRWPDMQHVDVGGNVSFIDDVSSETIMREINDLYINKQKYENMIEIAIKKAVNTFSYFDIAKRSIDL